VDEKNGRFSFPELTSAEGQVGDLGVEGNKRFASDGWGKLEGYASTRARDEGPTRGHAGPAGAFEQKVTVLNLGSANEGQEAVG
jgi:hypothetical protein